MVGLASDSTLASGLASFLSKSCPNTGEWSISKSPASFDSSISISKIPSSSGLIVLSSFYASYVSYICCPTTIWSFDSSYCVVLTGDELIGISYSSAICKTRTGLGDPLRATLSLQLNCLVSYYSTFPLESRLSLKNSKTFDLPQLSRLRCTDSTPLEGSWPRLDGRTPSVRFFNIGFGDAGVSGALFAKYLEKEDFRFDWLSRLEFRIILNSKFSTNF